MVASAQELTEAQAHKAHFLWRFADEAGHGCSRDEVADMVLMDRVRDICAASVVSFTGTSSLLTIYLFWTSIAALAHIRHAACRYQQTSAICGG